MRIDSGPADVLGHLQLISLQEGIDELESERYQTKQKLAVRFSWKAARLED